MRNFIGIQASHYPHCNWSGGCALRPVLCPDKDLDTGVTVMSWIMEEYGA